MKRIRPILFVFIVIIASFLLEGCFDKPDTYEDICEYVNDNIEDLEKLINDNEGFEKSTSFDYEKYLGSRTKVNNAYSYSSEIIEFSCGGSGLVSDSTYTGFYYSKYNTSFGLEFDEYRQTKDLDGAVTYHRDDGISFLYTKQIRPHWFYYYMEWH